MGIPSEVTEILRRFEGGKPIRTLDGGKPNWIEGFDSDQVWVETEKSRLAGAGSKAVPMQWIVDSYDVLQRTGELGRDGMSAKAAYRSAFIFALLSHLPGVTHQIRPIVLRLNRS